MVSGAVQFNDVELRSGDYLQVQGADAHEAFAVEDSVLFVAHFRGIQFSAP